MLFYGVGSKPCTKCQPYCKYYNYNLERSDYFRKAVISMDNTQHRHWHLKCTFDSYRYLNLWYSHVSYTRGCNSRPHDDVIKWKHFPRYWPFVRGIHRGPVNSPQKGQWRGALMFSLICAWINRWVNNREVDDLRRHQAHYDIIIMTQDSRHLSLVDNVICMTPYRGAGITLYLHVGYSHSAFHKLYKNFISLWVIRKLNPISIHWH